MPVPAYLEPLGDPQGDRRSAPRLLLSLGSSLLPCFSEVTIHDLSLTGMRLETSADLAVGDTIEVQLPQASAIRATIVWHDGVQYGCEFDTPIPDAAVSAALLRSTPLPPTAATEAPPARGRSRRWARLAVSAAVVGIGYLVVSAGLPPLVVGLILAGLALALLAAWCVWVLDHMLHLGL